jgi:N-acetyl-alpha-D-glucosaminyl L-malate synthase BshA
MRIGIVCYPTYGGSGVIATELGKALAARGHVIHFITYSQPVRLESFSENISYHEVPVPAYPLFLFPPYEIALTSKMVDVARFEKIDLLHVHYAIPHASSAYLAKKILEKENILLPFITTLHGTDITLVGKDKSYEPVVTFAINESDGVTAVSESLKKDTYAYFKIENEIEVIPNFIDLQRFAKQPKEHFRKAIADDNEKLIIHTSNFRKVKRVQDVVKVFQKIREKIKSKLLLVGDGPERANIEQLCRELHIYNEVRFLGKQDPVEELLSVSDLFILPSETESFGLAALEAMACQVPVISTNTGGLPEVNVHGITGFMSNVGDIQDMAENSIHILEDSQRLAQFKKNALQHASKYELKNILPVYEKYYEKVLERSRKKNSLIKEQV